MAKSKTETLTIWDLADGIVEINPLRHKLNGIRIFEVRPLFAPLNPDLFPPKVWEVFQRDEYQCWLCGAQAIANAHIMPRGDAKIWRPITDRDFFTVDHIVPVVFGGYDEKYNLKTACSQCNSRRGSQVDEAILSFMDEEQLELFVEISLNKIKRRLQNTGYATYKPEEYERDLWFWAMVAPVAHYTKEAAHFLARWDDKNRVYMEPNELPIVRGTLLS